MRIADSCTVELKGLSPAVICSCSTSRGVPATGMSSLLKLTLPISTRTNVPVFNILPEQYRPSFRQKKARRRPTYSPIDSGKKYECHFRFFLPHSHQVEYRSKKEAFEDGCGPNRIPSDPMPKCRSQIVFT